MIFTLLSILASVQMVYWHNRRSKIEPPPQWLKSLCFKYLTVLCCARQYTKPTTDISIIVHPTHAGKMDRDNQVREINLSFQNDFNHDYANKTQSSQNGAVTNNNKGYVNMAPHTAENICDSLGVKEHWQEEWTLVISIFDRFYFALFALMDALLWCSYFLIIMFY